MMKKWKRRRCSRPPLPSVPFGKERKCRPFSSWLLPHHPRPCFSLPVGGRKLLDSAPSQPFSVWSLHCWCKENRAGRLYHLYLHGWLTLLGWSPHALLMTCQRHFWCGRRKLLSISPLSTRRHRIASTISAIQSLVNYSSATVIFGNVTTFIS